ncbi:bZIP transcription factor [Akanthomyces lecanii RCEF 1005]|uniref:Putative transcription factor kapC n=2 Tax=Akanthomyces TaxID=150366 RepID=A0A168K9W8_CORDF|nr:bZIP transcription factor [Akanthomyces lecanii RCEF 1005]
MSSNGASNQEQHLRAQLELLQNHEAEQSPGSPSSGNRDSRDASARPSNGYDDLHFSSAQDTAARALATKSDADSHIHPDLRAAHEQQSPTGSMMQLSHQDHHSHSPVSSGGHQQGAPLAPAGGDPMAIDPSDGRKTNKRELSQSKRAAQNRAAQRAFRQRKEGYIKKLEQQVREYTDMETTIKQYQSENYALREYVIQLQSRLLETVGEFPPPPPNVNLNHAATAPPSQPLPAAAAATEAQQQQPESTTVGTPLEAVAQAVAGLAAQEQLSSEQRSQYTSGTFKADSHDQDTRSADEINRHLNSEEGTTA